MQKKAEAQRPQARAPKFAGREVLADVLADEITLRFSRKEIIAAAANTALESLESHSIKDVLAALPRSGSS
jgi:hypothetical protein